MSSLLQFDASNLNSVEELHTLFGSADSILKLQFPSCIRPPGFLVSDFREDIYFFEYHTRESFRNLMNYAYDVINENFAALRCHSPNLCYVGNSGSGKSYNLAALVCLLRTRKARGWAFSKNIVYISSCKLFFDDSEPDSKHVLQNGIYVLCEAFPDDADEICASTSWSDLVSFTLSKPRKSIVFIVDDWNYIISEEKQLQNVNNIKDRYKRMIKELVQNRFCIFAMSAGSEAMTSTNKQNRVSSMGNTLYLYGGLTNGEWETWKNTSRSPFYQQLSPEDELKLIDLTGLVPDYLSSIDEFYKQYAAGEDALSETFSAFERYLAPTIYDDLAASSKKFMSVDKDIFVYQMAHAIVDTRSNVLSVTLLDHRYFYSDSAGVLRSVCGLVRRAMRKILEQTHKDDFYAILTPEWMMSALQTGNAIVRGFAFEVYAIRRIVEHPSIFINVASTPCNVVRFSLDSPPPSELNTEGLTMFIPVKFNHRYVDAVLRYVRPLSALPKKRKKGNQNVVERRTVEIYAVQITLQSFQSHKKSLDFFKKGGDCARYELKGELVERCMLWVSAQLPGINAAIPVADADHSKSEPFSQHVNLIEIL